MFNGDILEITLVYTNSLEWVDLEPEFAYLSTKQTQTKLRDIHPRVTMVPYKRHVRVEVHAVDGVIGKNAIQRRQVIMSKKQYFTFRLFYSSIM